MADVEALDTPLIGDGDSQLPSTNGTGGDAVATVEAPTESDAAAKTDTPKDEPEVDYKAELEATQARLTKAENDLKSIQTGRQRTAERDDEIREIRLSVDAIKESNTALIKSMASGETDGLSAKLEQIDQDSQVKQAGSRLQRHGQVLLDNLIAAGNDSEGNQVVDVRNDARFAPIRSEWNRISEDAALEPSEKLTQLSTVVAQANLTMRGIDAEVSKKAVDEARNAGKRALEETGALDTDTGGRTGPSDGSAQGLLKKYNTGARVSKAEQTRIDEHLEALDDTPGSALG
ncbi:hypothetical protein LCGC14_0695370 [marine sediment metagenome]|uniref:Uncharacterized protein n=1 Tax=marine sediment metagenome TaxID=412755 RepID=A0A0F9T5I8_9ZZZZ